MGKDPDPLAPEVSECFFWVIPITNPGETKQVWEEYLNPRDNGNYGGYKLIDGVFPQTVQSCALNP